MKKMEYSFLVESIDLLRKSMDWFLYDNDLRHERVKTNRTLSKKWAYHKEQSFASNYFISFENLVQFKNLL